jgi:YrbI family 3-deoxy-D-manno-octulosonate 8-phosphate phosphatase
MSEEQLQAFFGKAKKVKLIAIGVDGVLTDAGMYFSTSGDMLRKFNRRDGMGVQLLKKTGIKSAVVSSIDSAIVRHWAEMFQVDFIRLGVSDKLHEIEKIQIRMGLKLDEVAYISDDVDEMEILGKVGFGVTVADGMKSNKTNSVYVTKRKGGEGAVRELIEIILASKKA